MAEYERMAVHDNPSMLRMSNAGVYKAYSFGGTDSELDGGSRYHRNSEGNKSERNSHEPGMYISKRFYDYFYLKENNICNDTKALYQTCCILIVHLPNTKSKFCKPIFRRPS